MLFTLLSLACSSVKDPHDHDHDEEVITRVVLTLTDSTGTSQDVTWSDPEGDGNSTADDVALVSGEEYDVQVAFWNDLSEPVEEITPEVVDEAEEHQVFTFAPDFLEVKIVDTDVNGMDLGLEQKWSTLDVGSGTLSLGLRHLPEEDGTAVKTADMDVDNLPGEWDAYVNFTVTVEQPHFICAEPLGLNYIGISQM